MQYSVTCSSSALKISALMRALMGSNTPFAIRVCFNTMQEEGGGAAGKRGGTANSR